MKIIIIPKTTIIDKNTSNNETLLLSKIGSRIAVNKDIVDKQTNANDTFDNLIDSKNHTAPAKNTNQKEPHPTQKKPNSK